MPSESRTTVVSALIFRSPPQTKTKHCVSNFQFVQQLRTKFTRAINVRMSLIAQRAINLMDNQSFLRKNVDNKLSSRRKFVDGPVIKTFFAPPFVAFPDADCSLRFVEPSCSDEKQSVSPSSQRFYSQPMPTKEECVAKILTHSSGAQQVTVCSIPRLCRT